MAVGFSIDPGAAISGIAQAQAQALQSEIEYANLQFQKEQARKEYDLATSARTDANGNTVYYDSAQKKWVTQLTPTQSAIAKAGEREQFASLTEDATRNRDVRRRQGARAEGAVEPFNQAEAGLQYDTPPSEGSIFGELSRLLAGGAQQRSNEAKDALGRQALRIGKGASISDIVKSSNDYLGQTNPDTILQARQAALTESGQRESQHQSKYLPLAQHYAQLEDAVGGAPQHFSNVNNEMSGTQAQMEAAIAAALAQGGAGVGNAYGGFASAAGRSPSFGGAGSISFSPDGAAQPGYLTVAPGSTVIDPATGEVIYSAPRAGGSGVGGGGGVDTTSSVPLHRLANAPVGTF